MKPSSTFKLSKQTKRSLALSNFRTPEDRNSYKKLMIQAQLLSGIIPKTPKQEVDNS